MLKTIEEFKQEINNGKIFSVTFIKKDGATRKLTGRIGVKKYVLGRGLKFDPKEKGLMTVYDFQNKGYRMMNLNGLISAKINKQEFQFERNENECTITDSK